MPDARMWRSVVSDGLVVWDEGLGEGCRVLAKRWKPVKLRREKRDSEYGAERKIPAGERVWRTAAVKDMAALVVVVVVLAGDSEVM